MRYKKIISCILAASLIFSITPVTAIDATGETETTVTDVPVIGDEIIPVESETEVVTETTVPEISEIPETSETVTEPLDFIEDENDFSMYSPVSADIQLNKVSETDLSISISWSGVYGETFSHYEVYCNGAVVQTDLTDTAYTVTGLAGGNEYGISVYAYDIEGNVIGMSDELRACTNLTLQGDRTLYEDIIVQNLYLNSGTLNVNGHTITVKNDLGIGSGTLFVNGGKIYVEHTFRQQWTNGNASYGYLKMTNPNDYICVNGDFYCYAAYSHSGWLTNGTLEVKGNFTQRRYSDFYNFCASDSHRVILSGEKLQTVTFDRTESRFNILEVRNYSADGVIFSTPVTMNKYIDNGCNVTFSNGERSGWTLEADETIEGDINLARGTLDLNGHKLTITGDLIHSGGTVLVNGGELEVQGDYRVQALNGTSYTNSTGVLNMTNEADTVRVMGQFVMQSTASHSGKLTAGTLEIGGNLTQAGANSYNFCTSGNHTVILNGTGKQTVSINDNGKDRSRFNNLKITNTSAEGVTFSRMAYVVGNLYNTETPITNGWNIYVPSTMKFADNAWNHDIWICENRVLSEDLEIGGTLYLSNGTLNLNGHTLTVKGNAYLASGNCYLNVNKGKLYVDGNFNMCNSNGDRGYGYLTMTNAEDYVCVNGDFYVYTYYASSKLTNGTIEVKGNFTQKIYPYGYADNFAPSGNHKVILSGDSLQTVSFDRTESCFHILEIQNYSDEGVVFKTNVTIGELIDNGCNVSFANGERSGWTLEADETIEGDINLARGTLDLNGHKLTITGDLIHSGGTVLVNGGELEVQGDYRVQALNGTSYTNSTGVLNMTNEADTVRVMGQFVMQSTASHSGKLTAGTLEIGGNLTQAGANSYNFCTSGNHTVILNGTGKQTVSINDNGKDRSRFNNLKITNTSAEGVTFSRMAYVVGNLYNTETPITNGWNIYVPSTMKFADNAWNHDIWICENRVLSEDLEIGGTLYLSNGTLNLNGHTLTVKGNAYLASGNCYLNVNKGKLYVDGNFNMCNSNGDRGYGYLTMTNAEDYVCVNGDFYVYTYYASSKLTNGTIEVKGNFTQRIYQYGNTNNFAPSGSHKVILSGGKLQKVDFATTQSYFNILEITKPLDTGYVFSRTPLWNELIEGKADTEAPTAPKNLKFVRSNSSSIAMTWSASSDNAAVYCYYIYRNGERVGDTTKTEYIDNDLKSHTSYEYYIVACDTSGNLSEWSNILEASTDVDAFAPTQPANLAAKVQSEGVIRLSWTASSDNGIVVKYNVYRNGTLIGSSNGTAFTDSTAFGGYYEYYVEAVDNEDNVSRASASVFIDNLAPSAPVLTLNSVTDDYVSLSWECSDNVAISKYDLYRNNVKIKSLNANMYIDTSVSLDTNYTYYVVAYDAAGNISENSNEVTVYTGDDDVAPVISSIEYVGKPSYQNAVITVSATDNCGVSKIYLKYSSDKINWTDCGSEIASGKASVTVKFGVDTSEMTDGTVYLCAYAEDISGNVSSIENSPIYSFTVDNTAPDAPTDVTLNIKNAQIEIRWTAPKDKDTSYFKVYRKTDNSDFVLIKDNCKYINYFDKDIELGVEYSYYVTAVDQNGNESDYSEIVTGGISDDNVKPEILSISPANNSKIGEDVFVSISCRDNYKLGSITVTCKKANNTDETEVFKSELSKYAEVVGFDLDTSNFENGLYEISAVAVDSVGNISDKYTVTYDYKGCGLSAPVLSAGGAGWSVNLSWDMTNTDGLVDYYVYRKSSTVSDYVAVASVTESKYTDYDVTAGKKYYYKVRAWDDRDNYIESNEVAVSPTYEDTFAPVANAGFDLFAIVGESLTFDGSQSYDNHYVASYEWNFGDGTTAEGVMPKHSYSEAGEYTVKLTVKDSGGNSDSASIKVTVYDDEYSKVEITTLSGSSRLGNVMIYCELPNSESTDFSTNSNGTFELIAPKGTYTVYFYKSGYTPVSTQIDTEKQKKVSVSLKSEQFITGKWKVETLDLDEIVANGIDVNDPANQVVYRYTADVKGNGQVSFIVNGDGEFFGDDFAEFEYEDKRTKVAAKSFGGSGSRGGSYNRRPSSSGGSGGGSSERSPQMIAIFSVTTNISWLKEFFEVELTITNEAGNEFYLDNSKAEITLPDGLSLADTLIGEWESKNMGIIKGGQSESASWILRGDKPGEYTDVKAKFFASLMPFGEPVTVDFVNDGAPIVVHGSEGISLKVTASEYDDYWSMKFVLTNNSGRPLYNVLASFEGEVEVGEITDMILYYSNGTTITIPWNGGKPQYEFAEEYCSAFDPIDVKKWTDEYKNDISKYTLENEDTLTGMYSVSKEWVYK